MKLRVTILSFMAFVCGTVAAVALAAESLTNTNIIDLQKLDLGEAVIIEKIKTSTCNFDTSTEGLKQLKGAGVPNAVIAAMISGGSPKSPASAGDLNDPAAPHEAGIWLFEESNGQRKMTKLQSSVISGTRSGGGWGPWGSSKSKAVLSGQHAALQIATAGPVFYFYFEDVTSVLSRSTDSVTAPNEFSLGKMEIKNSKNERRLTLGSYDVGGGRTGPDPKQIRQFESEKTAPGVYKVKPRDLDPGEYCFFYAGTGSAWGMHGGGDKMFDFGISAQPTHAASGR